MSRAFKRRDFFSCWLLLLLLLLFPFAPTTVEHKQREKRMNEEKKGKILYVPMYKQEKDTTRKQQ